MDILESYRIKITEIEKLLNGYIAFLEKKNKESK